MTDQPSTIPNLPTMVAHRGNPLRYPENTLVGYESAVAVGARFLELDVQLTSDFVPMLHHDSNTLRMSGTDAEVSELTVEEMRELPAAHPERFDSQFDSNRFSTLLGFSEWLAKHPGVQTFVEIKTESIDAFGVETVVDRVLDAIGPARNQVILISFHDGAIELARSKSDLPVGWVLPEWTDKNRQRLASIQPSFMFCGTERLPADRQVWPGSWRWVLYNTDTVAETLEYFGAGFDMLETNAIADVLQSQAFQPRG